MDLRPRTLIQRLNDAVNPAETEADEGQAQPEPAPAATVPARPVRGGGRLPDWRAPKHDLGDDEPAGEEQGAVATKADVTKADVTKADVTKADAAEADAADVDVDEEEQEDAEERDEDDANGDAVDVDDEEQPGEKEQKAPGRRWGVRWSGKKVYSRPSYGTQRRSPKRSVLEAWDGMRPVTRHGLYNGTALALGFALGVPQFFTAETAYLVTTYHSWTDFWVCVWYGVAVGIWMLDHRTRTWLPPFALAARMPLVSMAVGVLLYGTPA